MRALVQRVSQASVWIKGEQTASIGRGLLILLGVGPEDGEEQVQKLWSKISKLRIFEDESGKTNLNLAAVEGEVLVVSQFTLYASCRRGNRPSFTDAAPPQRARELYERFVALARAERPTQTGEFGAMMNVQLVNDGPFTLWLDTQNL